MKYLFFLSFCFLSIAASAQTEDFNSARKKAKEEGKMILIEFSGSDWCIPCIRLEKEVFNKEAFIKYADAHLVLLKADFPRLKKHELPKDIKQQNEALAEVFNPGGAFPYTVLLDADGKVLKSWEGAAFDAESLVSQVQVLAHAK